MLRTAILAAFFLGCWRQDQRSRCEANVTRTRFGIPHIASNIWQGLGYGVGYADAEDNFCLLAEVVVPVAGERSRHFGA